MAGFGSLGSSRRSCLDCNPFSLNFRCIQLIMLLRGSFSSKIQNATAQKAKNQALPSWNKLLGRKITWKNIFLYGNLRLLSLLRVKMIKFVSHAPTRSNSIPKSFFIFSNNLVPTTTTGS